MTNLVSSVSFKFTYHSVFWMVLKPVPDADYFILVRVIESPLCLFPSWNFSFLGIISPEVSSDSFLFCHILHVCFILFFPLLSGRFLKVYL